MQEYESSTDTGLLDYYRRVKNGEDAAASYPVGTVNSRAAQAMRDLTGIDAENSTVLLDKNGVSHIVKRHTGGANSADATMKNDLDVARIQYVLDNFDDAFLSKEKTKGYFLANGKRSPGVVFTKKVDGHYAVVEAVTDGQKKRNYIVSAFMTDDINSPEFQKSISSRWQSPDVQAPWITSETAATLRNEMQGNGTIPSGNSMPHSAGNVNTGTSYLPDNTPVSYTWKVVDANDLVSSNDALGAPNPSYPKEYQNRNRDSAASVQQITRMANNLNPERLADSANIGDGSPLIRSDNVVLSGNGRTSAIQQAYRTGKADSYKTFVQQNAHKYGIDPATLPQNPVLVRVADDGQDMLSIARKANESTTASFGASENALNYAGSVLGSSQFDRLDPSVPVTEKKNESFVKSILSDIVPQSEYNRMVKSDGSVSVDGYKTVKDALFGAAYGTSDRLFLLAEGGDDASRNITAAMRDSYREIMPDATDEEIRKAYAKYLKDIKKG